MAELPAAPPLLFKMCAHRTSGVVRMNGGGGGGGGGGGEGGAGATHS